MPVSFQFKRHPSGSVGCTVGLAPHVFVGGYGDDAVDALKVASSLAAEMDSVLKKNPALAAVVPPQVTGAMKAIALASRALQDGATMKQVSNAAGQAVASAVSKILSIF